MRKRQQAARSMDTAGTIMGVIFFSSAAAALVGHRFRGKVRHLSEELAQARQREEALERELVQCRAAGAALQERAERERERLCREYERGLAQAEARIPPRFVPGHPCTYTVQSMDESGQVIHREICSQESAAACQDSAADSHEAVLRAASL